VIGAAGSTFAADSGGNFLVTPNVGLMIWTLIAFGLALFLLQRLAFPRIGEALDKRRMAIEESIEAAERTRREADQLLEEYRERLREARDQAEEIVTRSRKAAERLQEETIAEARQQRDELLERTRRDIEQETRRALEDIRKEVANLTVLATEKLARKSLDDDDHRRLVQEALSEIDFSVIASESNGGSQN
jgi:F-type H+-transporting ATPase subunit b